MLLFAAAVFGLIITPGPGVLSTAGVGSAFGYAAGTRYVTGLFVGTNMVALAVVSGVAAFVLADPRIPTILFYVSVAYLLYLAVKIAFSGRKIAFISSSKPPGFWNAIGLQAVNPKAYVVNTAMFTGFGFMPDDPAMELVLKFIIMNAIWIPIHFLWLAAGVMLHRLDLAPRTHFIINVLMAVSMLAVVALATLAPR